MPRDDSLETPGIQRASLDELKQAGLVLRPAGLKRDGGEVFSGEDARGRAFHIHCDRIAQSFLDEPAGGWKELHRPAGDDDILALHRAATGCEVIEYRHR